MSKNNLKERVLKMEDKKNHFSIRKLTIGAASVLIGTTLFLNSNSVKADTLPASEQTENTQNNLDNKDKLDTTTVSNQPAFEGGVAGIPLVEEVLPEYDGPIKPSAPTKTEIIPNETTK